jgi:hypothetical protein
MSDIIDDDNLYVNYRDSIKSGDLLAWGSPPSSILHKVINTFIRLFTLSEFAHVGVAWVTDGRVFVIEATFPRVQISPLSKCDQFYHIPLKIEWKHEYATVLLELVGCGYSIKDCVRGYLGKITDDKNKWQCAELAHYFYTKTGILKLGNCCTPSSLVNCILSLDLNTTIRHIVNTK